MANSLSQGFLLSRQSHDTHSGILITFWLASKLGPVKLEIPQQQAVFFVTQQQTQLALACLKENNVTLANHQALKLKTFQNEDVSAFYFNYLRDYYQARDLLKQYNIKCYEDDFRPEERYLMERFITAGITFQGQQTTKQGNQSRYQIVQQAQCKPSQVDIQLTMLSLDIECGRDGQLFSIGAYQVIKQPEHENQPSEKIERVFIIGERPANSEELPSFMEYVNDEKTLLNCFINWFNMIDPDIVIGWNVVNFDFDLLQKRCDLHQIKFAIGRDRQSPYWRKNRQSEQKYIAISGRVVLDGIDLLKTATYNFPSFSLDNVANTLLGVGKEVTDVDNRFQEIIDNFHHNKPALATYNLADCRLVWEIFEKTDLLAFAQLRAQLTGLEIDRMGGSVAAFTNLYLPKLHRSGYVAPNMGDGTQDFVSPGGYVMDSLPGLYDNVLVLDFKSLYPSIIRTFNIDPMGMIEGINLHECSPEQVIEGYDGAYFSRKHHFLPNIIKGLWAERDKAKLEKNAALSQAIKIIMNSFYGVLGSTGCRFFDPRLSGSITKRSHDILKITQKWIEEKYGFTVIYGDTDSIFVHLGSEFSKVESLTTGQQLATFINKKWQEYLQKKYDIECELEIEFESHFSKFLMPTIRGLDIGTKKRYAGLVIENEQQHIIFKGLESVRTDWTELAKIFQRELYHRVFNNLPVADYVLEMCEKTYAGEFDHLLIYRKRIRRELKDYVKNIPPHVKAARMADDLNLRQGKALRYQHKSWIEYLITNNGPQAKEWLNSPLDYQFYVDRQLKAVADGILPFINTSFDQITDQQLNLFDF